MAFIDKSKSFQEFIKLRDKILDTESKIADNYFVKDEITKSVITDLAERSIKGYKKYETTLGENNHQNMLQHAYEEALDLAQYLKKEITTLNTIQNLVQQYPNDIELGKVIRAKYGQK
jgi:predicted phage-related endonuclease